jgi:hypothetical protein
MVIACDAPEAASAADMMKAFTRNENVLFMRGPFVVRGIKRTSLISTEPVESKFFAVKNYRLAIW